MHHETLFVKIKNLFEIIWEMLMLLIFIGSFYVILLLWSFGYLFYDTLETIQTGTSFKKWIKRKIE